MREAFPHVVVGAGISGLGLAHRTAHTGVETLVLEAADRIGGCINSRPLQNDGGFWVEAGGHTCFNSYGHLLDILGNLRMMDRLAPKPSLRYALWRHGARRSILSALHPLELIVSLPRLFVANKAHRSVAEYYGKGLGRRNYQDLFGPAFRAVICQVADDFPAELLFRRKARRKDVVRSFTFPGGLSEIPAAIARQDRIEVRTGQRVSAVRRGEAGFRVVMEDGTEISSSYASLAVSPDAAARLLAEDFPGLSALLSQIGVAEIESVILGVSPAHLQHLPSLAGLIAVDDAFFSMVSRDYLEDAHLRGFAFHFPRGVLPPEVQVERACQAIGITPDRVTSHARAINRLPALRVGHRDLVSRVDAELTGQRLALTGNWFLGVSIEDCLTRTDQEFRRVFQVCSA